MNLESDARPTTLRTPSAMDPHPTLPGDPNARLIELWEELDRLRDDSPAYMAGFALAMLGFGPFCVVLGTGFVLAALGPADALVGIMGGLMLVMGGPLTVRAHRLLEEHHVARRRVEVLEAEIEGGEGRVQSPPVEGVCAVPRPSRPVDWALATVRAALREAEPWQVASAAASVGAGWLVLDRMDAVSPLWVFGALLAFIVANRLRHRFFGPTEPPGVDR